MAEAIDEKSLEWMPKSVWGPIKWKELHTRGLIELGMEHEADWFTSFVDGLPCPKCRDHFCAFIEQSPPDFRSRSHFFAWTVAAHNYVNQATQKPSLTVEAALKVHRFDPEP
jgi:hypothetical protein